MRWSFATQSRRAFKRSSTTAMSRSRARWDGCFRRRAAETTVQHIRGVRGVLNHITVAPRAPARDVHRRIVKALHQDADVDARHITVTVSDNTATLTGTVGTWLQRDCAERAAANAPGIAHVANRIVVQSFEDSKMDDWDDIC